MRFPELTHTFASSLIGNSETGHTSVTSSGIPRSRSGLTLHLAETGRRLTGWDDVPNPRQEAASACGQLAEWEYLGDVVPTRHRRHLEGLPSELALGFRIRHKTLINLYDRFLRRVIDRVRVVFRLMPGDLNNPSIPLLPKAVRVRIA